jgi:two-component system sensor histidine kinase QseC
MKSIRFYLITTILAAMTLLIFLSALHGYDKSTKEAKNLLDKQLVDMANVLSSLQIQQEHTQPFVTDVESTNTAFQIWHNQQLINRSSNAPDKPITQLVPGFHDNNFGQYRWRIYVHLNEYNQRWVITAERADSRNRLIDNFILESVLPIILTLPIAAILIWLLIGSGLKPLRQLARQVQHKQEHDLSPVTLTGPLNELQPLVDSTNNLLARLERSLTRAKRFSSDAAHELRTPISGLKINLHNLQTESPDDKNLKLLSAGVNRMGHVVEQILSLYRTTPDQYMANFDSHDLHAIAQQSIAQYYPHIETKQQQIELSGESVWFQCDQFTIETLLQNLLGNANKYTPKGGNIKITISQIDDAVRLKVEDSGPGIPEDKYHRVFDRFYRLDGDQHTSEIEGCGLGLSIVQHIVQLHHGEVKLSHSKFDTGLAITINFPTVDSINEQN